MRLACGCHGNSHVLGALALIATACSARQPSPPTARVTITPAAVTSASALPVEAKMPEAPPTWPTTVDLSLSAPDGFHLIAAHGNEALVTVTGMREFREPRMGNALVHGNTDYIARVDLRTGCMEATYDFPTLGAAASTGTVKKALEVLARPAMVEEIARAKTITSTFGPNDASIRITPDGKNVVLEANNEIYWAKNGGTTFTHLPGVAKGPLVSNDGVHLLYGSGGGAYRPVVMDFATGRTRAVTRTNGGAALSQMEAYPMADGSFLSVENDGLGLRKATRVCAMRIDPEHVVETEAVCVPSDVNSASVSELSADSRFLAIHVERHGGDRILTFDTKTWQKITDAPGSPNYMDVDDTGRVAWDDVRFDRVRGPLKVIVVAEGATVKPVDVPPGPRPDIAPTFVGFVGHQMIVGYPTMPPFATSALKTLGEAAPCGHLRLL